MKKDQVFLTDAQFKKEAEKCEYCEERGCTAKCPANCSPMDFIRAAKKGMPSDFKRSAGLIMTANPFGGICGMVCPDRHCMAGCVYKEFDKSVEIPDIQSYIVEKAKQLKVMPELDKIKPNGKKIAVIGAGPSGLAAALYLSQKGYKVDIFEKEKTPGGMCNLIPEFRLPKKVLKTDIDFILKSKNIKLYTNKKIEDIKKLKKRYNAVIVAAGLWQPFKLGIENEDKAISSLDYLKQPKRYNVKNKIVAVIGGAATAADCALTAKKAGAKRVEMFSLETLSEMILTQKEIKEIIENQIVLNGRISVKKILVKGKKIAGIETVNVSLPDNVQFNLRDIKEVENTNIIRSNIEVVIIAIGNRTAVKKLKDKSIYYTGDCENGPTTVVEAVAAGKNTAAKADAALSRKKPIKIDNPVKSYEIISGYNQKRVNLETDFFGRKIKSPFILSAAPPSDGYNQMKKAYEAGWAGGIMKTAFDNVPIHIPGEYMHAFGDRTYGNCDNVSGHSLTRVCREIKRLVKEYPDRLTMASTGGPVTGNDEADKKVWQRNTKKIEKAGAYGIEYSLSCPQGGDGTEGDIVSQNAELTAKIIDWVMEVSAPDIPKLFKLTAAVTSIIPIAKAIKQVFKKYPNKKAGITLANTFPTMIFRDFKDKKRKWEQGIVVGMSGEGVTPISYLTLANVSGLNIHVSGNGGPMDYKAAADFLALGVKTVQFCTIAMKYGYGIINDLESGISHLMESRGIKSIKELTGIALPEPIRDFMDLTPTKKISAVNEDLCEHCGNCSRCPYLAISYKNNKIVPVTDPSKCIGCSICVQKCFSGALYMRDRTKDELKQLKED